MPYYFRRLNIPRGVSIFGVFLIFIFFVSKNQTFGALGIGTTYEVNDDQAIDGDVLCLGGPEAGGKLARCQKPFDETMFGVLADDPSVVLRQSEKGKTVIQQGRALVNATTLGGSIKTGDYVTTSAVTGKAQKAQELLGYILGKSLSNLSENDGKPLSYNGKNLKEAQIEISLAIGPLGVLPRGTFLDKIGFTLVRGTQTPAAAGLFLRYVTAGLLVILVGFFAFNNFGRNITKGMESIGRNPLAKNQIQFVIIINTVLIAATIIGAIFLALIIIRL